MAEDSVKAALFSAARWTNKTWKKGPGGKAALVGAGLFTPLLLLPAAVALCVGTEQLDKEKAAEAEKDKTDGDIAS